MSNFMSSNVFSSNSALGAADAAVASAGAGGADVEPGD
jgi:hypothetical protein